MHVFYSLPMILRKPNFIVNYNKTTQKAFIPDQILRKSFSLIRKGISLGIYYLLVYRICSFQREEPTIILCIWLQFWVE